MTTAALDLPAPFLASTMGVILSKLRKLGLVDKGARRVASEFMESIA